jgi:ubiquitin-protein ligase E3 D
MILDVLLSSQLFCGDEAPRTHDASLLHTLVSRLRGLDSGESMLEIAAAHDDAALFQELQSRVDQLFDSSDESPSVDAQLAKTLVCMLNCLQRLLSTRTIGLIATSSISTSLPSTVANPNIYDTLKRSLAEFQSDRNLHTHSNSNPVSVVENALLWSQIDTMLEQVMTLCRQRQRTLEPLRPPTNLDTYPPEYDLAGSPTDDILPAYDGPRSSFGHEAQNMKRPPFSQERLVSATIQSEKMRLDLEAVTFAIDRLYLVAPQLLDQRVELNASKRAELEKARQAGKGKGKQKQVDLRELEEMVEMIGKASERKIADQTYVMDNNIKARQERARRRDNEQVGVSRSHQGCR